MRYFVMWTYLGNYSNKPTVVEASSPGDAAVQATAGFSDDFADKANVYVFTQPPVMTCGPTNGNVPLRKTREVYG